MSKFTEMQKIISGAFHYLKKAGTKEIETSAHDPDLTRSIDQSYKKYPKLMQSFEYGNTNINPSFIDLELVIQSLANKHYFYIDTLAPTPIILQGISKLKEIPEPSDEIKEVCEYISKDLLKRKKGLEGIFTEQYSNIN